MSFKFLNRYHPATPVNFGALVSALLLAGVLVIEYVFKVPPCDLCIWQRVPYGTVILVALVMFAMRLRLDEIHWGWGAIGVGLLMGLSGDIGAYHVGVEQGWWDGPSGCSAQSLSQLNVKEALESILDTPLVRCDEVAMTVLGLSLAAWNAIIGWVCGLLCALAGLYRLRYPTDLDSPSLR